MIDVSGFNGLMVESPQQIPIFGNMTEYLLDNGGCAEWCTDVRVFDDGYSSSTHNSQLFYTLYNDNAGLYNHFQTTGIIIRDNGQYGGWHTICAPLSLGDPLNFIPPSSGSGQWTGSGSSSLAAWRTWLEDITRLRITTDLSGSFKEYIGYDNFCLYPVECEVQSNATDCDSTSSLSLQDLSVAAMSPNTVGACSIYPACSICNNCDYVIEAGGFPLQNTPSLTISDWSCVVGTPQDAANRLLANFDKCCPDAPDPVITTCDDAVLQSATGTPGDVLLLALAPNEIAGGRLGCRVVTNDTACPGGRLEFSSDGGLSYGTPNLSVYTNSLDVCFATTLEAETTLLKVLAEGLCCGVDGPCYDPCSNVTMAPSPSPSPAPPASPSPSPVQGTGCCETFNDFTRGTNLNWPGWSTQNLNDMSIVNRGLNAYLPVTDPNVSPDHALELYDNAGRSHARCTVTLGDICLYIRHSLLGSLSLMSLVFPFSMLFLYLYISIFIYL